MVDIEETYFHILNHAYYYSLATNPTPWVGEDHYKLAAQRAGILYTNLLGDMSMFDPRRIPPRQFNDWLVYMSLMAQAGWTKFVVPTLAEFAEIRRS